MPISNWKGSLFLAFFVVSKKNPQKQLAENIIKHHTRYFKTHTQYSTYLEWLEKISTLNEFTRVFSKEKIFIGLQFDTNKNEEIRIPCYAKDCVLVDDSRTLHVFNPLHCPENSTLEQFYLKCGARWMSHWVQEHVQIGPIVTNNLLVQHINSVFVDKPSYFK